VSAAVETLVLGGPAARPHAAALADLRIAVFREFPYLYDGSRDYEVRYLETYFQCPEAVCVLVFAAGALIGASTGLPLAAAWPEFQRPFETQGIALDAVFYFGESILLPAWRGQGLGHRFFEAREAWARRLGGFSRFAFCAVERPPDHPGRPHGYHPHDRFWTGRGYRRHPELRAALAWPDLGEATPSEKSLTFWMREA
jgi:GNAT superfamily N-acetyltransferase